MKYLQLILAGLSRNKTRTTLTVVSVIAAFVLFGVLDSVRSAFANAGQAMISATRLITVSRLGLATQLPKSLADQIAKVPGVAAVSYSNWFGGTYRDAEHSFPNAAVSTNFFDMHPEREISEAQRQAFANTRTGAIAGESLARKNGWKIGDKIPLQATIFPQMNGSNTWIVDLVGTYRINEPKLKSQENLLVFNWDYFDEARAFGNGTIGWYVLQLKDPSQAQQVAQAVDALSANSDHETRTQTESAFEAAFVNQFADVGLIVGAIILAVYFTLIFVTGNTMAQAVRERIPEFAVLKTIGFTGRAVLALTLAESVLLVVVGGVIGVGLAMALAGAIHSKMTAIPMDPVGVAIWLRALLLMTLIGLIVGSLPALRGMRLRIADALAES